MPTLKELSTDQLLSRLSNVSQGTSFQVGSNIKNRSTEDLINKLNKSTGNSSVSTQDAPRSNLLNDPIGTLKRSGGDVLKSTVGAVTDPIGTAKAIGGLGVGAVQKFIPGEQGQEQNVDALLDFYKERYGSLENAQRTLLEDPVGFAADLSLFASGGGSAVAGLGKLSKTSQITRAGQRIGSIGKAIDPVGAAFRGAGKATGKLLEGRNITPFGRSPDKGVINAANRIDVAVPASATTDGRAVPIIESLAGKGLFGDPILEKFNQAQDRLNDFVDEVVAKTGKSPDLSVAGRAVVDGVDEFRDRFFKTKEELFKKSKIVQKGKLIDVEPTNSLPFIQSVLEDKQRASNILGQADDIGFFKQLSENLVNKNGVRGLKSNVADVRSAIRQLNEKLKNRTDPIVTGNQGVITKLVTLLDEDVDAAVLKSSPELAADLNRANTFFKQGLDRLNSEFGKKIFKLRDKPDKIVPAIINRSTSVEDIPRIYEIIGQENIPSVQSAVLEQVFKKARNADGNFTANGINKQLRSLGEDKLRAILSNSQMQALLDLDEVSRGLGKAGSVAGGSQTAFIARLAAQAGTLFVNPLQSLKLVVGDALLSKAIGSDTGQRILSQGLRIPRGVGNNLIDGAPIATGIGRVGRFADIVNEN